jgi:hypothetical protein
VWIWSGVRSVSPLEWTPKTAHRCEEITMLRIGRDHVLIEELEITNAIRLPREHMEHESHGARRRGELVGSEKS